MSFNINRAINDDVSDSPRNSDYQKMFNDEAPSLGYISSKAPCEFIMVPPHPSHGASMALTSGGFRSDKERGITPTLGQYGIDHVIVYRKIGNNPDPKQRRDILAINMVETEEGLQIQAEREWGKGYMSPMYKLREFLWRTGGGHKYNKVLRRSEPTIKNIDTNTWEYKRALELVPADGNDLNAPLGRGVRTLFLQGFVINNAGISYTTDEDGQACWPKHKILMINQVSAIKSRLDAFQKEGFYDALFVRKDGTDMDPQEIEDTYGDILNNPSALQAWEQGFVHGDFSVNQKLVTFSSYRSGPAGISTYKCSVQNLADKYGPDYKLPDEILRKARPMGDYILKNNEQLQIEWLQELFAGDEWALEGAGLINKSSVRIAVPAMPAAPAAPIAAPAPAIRPVVPAAAPSIRPAVEVPVAAAPKMPSMPMPSIPGAAPKAPSVAPASDDPNSITARLFNLAGKIDNRG